MVMIFEKQVFDLRLNDILSFRFVYFLHLLAGDNYCVTVGFYSLVHAGISALSVLLPCFFSP